MNTFKKFKAKWSYFRIWIWSKLMIRTEDIRLKAETWIHAMDSKIKDR